MGIEKRNGGILIEIDDASGHTEIRIKAEGVNNEIRYEINILPSPEEGEVPTGAIDINASELGGLIALLSAIAVKIMPKNP